MRLWERIVENLIVGKPGRIVRYKGKRVREIILPDGKIVHGAAPPMRMKPRGLLQSGVPGVTWHPKTKRWTVRIYHDGRLVTLGRFRELADAVDCRMTYDTHGFEEARHLGDLEKSNIKTERLAAARTREEQKRALRANMPKGYRKRWDHVPYPHAAVLTGERVQHGYQEFMCVDVQEHETQAGRVVRLHVWEGECTECGERFRFRVSEHAKVFAPAKRCGAHAMPGKATKKSPV